MDENQLERAMRTGRRVGVAVFGGIIAAFVLICSAQIMYQGFSEPRGAALRDCREGIRTLVNAVREARTASSGGDLDERTALRRFREVVVPAWTSRPDLVQKCGSDSWATRAVQAVDEWRWAEENAVRYESVDLAPSRRRIQAIEAKLGRPSERP